MKVQYHNRHPLPDSKAEGAAYVSFEELISTSDVISLNLALTHSTEHIIGEREFEKMKNGVVIINTARGALIDEQALISALESGKVYSVGLDVFENEPKVNPLLLENEKILVAPHIAAATIETVVSTQIICISISTQYLHQNRLPWNDWYWIIYKALFTSTYFSHKCQSSFSNESPLSMHSCAIDSLTSITSY
jgi:glyoxylate reductase